MCICGCGGGGGGVVVIVVGVRVGGGLMSDMFLCECYIPAECYDGNVRP